MQEDTIVLHRYGDRSHFAAINPRVSRYLTCDPFYFLGRAAKAKLPWRVALTKIEQVLRDLFCRAHARNYVYGFAPDSSYFILLALLWWRSGRRILFTSFSDPPEQMGAVRRSIVTANLAFAGRFFHGCTAVSVSARDILSPYLKTVLVEHAIDTDAYQAHGKRAGMIYLGRIAPYKNTDIIIKAAKQADVPLTLVGPAPVGAAPQTDQTTAHYLGPKSKDWIKASLGQYEALVLASDEREPFGIVLLEAMASGVPVIATQTHGTRTVFRDWPDYPLLLDTPDVSELTASLIRFNNMPEIEKRDIRERLAAMARAYRPEALAARWDQVLA